MEALKLNLKIESDTVKIPELSRFIGKRIEIILLDDSSTETPRNQHTRFKKLKGMIHFDDNEITFLRERSLL